MHWYAESFEKRKERLSFYFGLILKLVLCMNRNQNFQKNQWVHLLMAEDEGYMPCLWGTWGQANDTNALSPLVIWSTSSAYLREAKGNMCYVPGFLSLNKAHPHLAQIDVWSTYLDSLFVIYSKKRLKTCKYSNNLSPWKSHENPKKVKIATTYILWKYYVLSQYLK